jgi:UDP-3-O-[3-hydroxymyristoyl] glucosamine N-acyltransferase
MKAKRISAGELAALAGAEIEGPAEFEITHPATADVGGADAIVLAEDDRYFRKAVESQAGCILTGRGIGTASDRVIIRAADPKVAFIKVLEFFKRDEWQPTVGVGPGAVVEPGAVVGRDVAIGANCCLCAGASIGDGCVLFPNVFVGEGVTVGDNCKLYPGVTIYQDCRIGSRVVLHAGTVIGADGFGYAPGPEGLRKFPHVGTVEIGDDVEIGANSAVDRAKMGATLIGRGTKIDNLVHVAHNVRIGCNCVIVALTGIAGSVEVGNGVTLAAQTGVSDHVTIGDGCVVAARGGVIGDVAPGSVVSGFPARDHRTELRMQAIQLRLPEMMDRLRAVEKELDRLRNEHGR